MFPYWFYRETITIEDIFPGYLSKWRFVYFKCSQFGCQASNWMPMKKIIGISLRQRERERETERERKRHSQTDYF